MESPWIISQIIISRYLYHSSYVQVTQVLNYHSTWMYCMACSQLSASDRHHLQSNSKQCGYLSLSHDLARYQDIVPWDIVVQIPTMLGSSIYCHEHFVVVIDINDSVMATPAANNGHDDVTEIHVTSKWFGIL